MSNQVVDARPPGEWSGPKFAAEAKRLHEHYSRFCHGVPLKRLTAIGKACVGYLYDSDMPLSDGYVPAVTVYLKAPLGKIAIVFPRFGLIVNEDGTNTERSVTIHELGGPIEERYVHEIVDLFIDCLPASSENIGTVASYEECERSVCG